MRKVLLVAIATLGMMSCSKDEMPDDVGVVEIPKDCKCGNVSFVRFAPNPIIKVINDCTGNEKVVDNPTPTQLEIADRTMYLCFPQEW